MFGLDKKTDYGLELMIGLARAYGQGPISLRQIAKQKKLPVKYLEQIILSLRAAGLVEAKEGRGGGYFLADKPQSITVSEVVEAINGPVELGVCMGCPKAAMCGQKDIWSEVGDKVREAIEGKSLAELVKKA